MKVNDSKTYTFAKLYGLRNIQNLIRNLKKAPSKYVYIEMMACPGGCLNGGGQIKNKEIKYKELLEKLNKIMHDEQIKICINPFENPAFLLIKRFYKVEDLFELFSSDFHAIEKYENLNW